MRSEDWGTSTTSTGEDLHVLEAALETALGVQEGEFVRAPDSVKVEEDVGDGTAAGQVHQ
jgi:hypothetical protein